MRTLSIALVLGVAVGASGWVADQGPVLVKWTSAIAAAWLIGAFVGGALARGAARAAVAGAATIVVGVGTYYVLFFVMEGVSLRYGVVAGIAWSTVGVGIGAVLGWAGHAWRAGRLQPVGVALLSGALVGEAMLLLGEWQRPAARAVLACELVLGAMLPFVLARRRLAVSVALTMLVAVVVDGAEDSVRHAMRAAGWRGA
jgi:hypothetical protein